ncbi:MAG: glutamate racemase [Actinobacteria bacterium]|nr:glutamate racemase [Actinomycetota bacterium]OPZ78952.1 MAG: Glutamate racemase [Actinobacteria bacterium ADurb.Bin444]
MAGLRSDLQHSEAPLPDRRPIGVFDSGVGGLTVLHECLVNLPHEDFVYLGDTAAFPYGPRSHDEVRRLAFHNVGFLVDRGVKLIVVACNSATAVALPQLQASFDTPIVGVVMPGARAAVQATRTRRVGLMATEATVRSGSYQRALHVLDAGIEVEAVACPLLAPLIQEGDVFSERVEDAVREYVGPLKKACVDTVILGCTHYPLLTPMLRRLLGPRVALVNSAEEIAREVVEIIDRKQMGNVREREGTYAFFATSNPEEFRAVGARFLQLPIREVGLWDGVSLLRPDCAGVTAHGN